jgi:hypothetical protein
LITIDVPEVIRVVWEIGHLRNKIILELYTSWKIKILKILSFEKLDDKLFSISFVSELKSDDKPLSI